MKKLRVFSMLLALCMVLSTSAFAVSPKSDGRETARVAEHKIGNNTYYSEVTDEYSLSMNSTTDGIYAYYKNRALNKLFTYYVEGNANIEEVRKAILEQSISYDSVKSIDSITRVYNPAIVTRSLNADHEALINKELEEEFSKRYSNILLKQVVTEDHLTARLVESLSWNITPVLLFDFDAELTIGEIAAIFDLLTVDIKDLFNWVTLGSTGLALADACTAGQYSIKVMVTQVARVNGVYQYSANQNTFCDSTVGNRAASLDVGNVLTSDGFDDYDYIINKALYNHRTYG